MASCSHLQLESQLKRHNCPKGVASQVDGAFWLDGAHHLDMEVNHWLWLEITLV